MTEDSPQSWDGTQSVLELLAAGTVVSLKGTGTLELEEGEWEPQTPRGPGRVQFTLTCGSFEYREHGVEPVRVLLLSADDEASRILRGEATSRVFQPLPSYRLSGISSKEQGGVPVQMEAVTLDPRDPSPIHVGGGKVKTRSKATSVGRATIGRLPGLSELTSCRMLIPNFAGKAEIETSDLRIVLSEIAPEITYRLSASESWGKVLPGAYLNLQSLTSGANELMASAIDALGWLLSFYAGRRIHPMAWEGKSTNGPVWRIQDLQPITPLGGSYVNSCLGQVPLDQFLQYAWKAWQNHNEKWRGRLKGATNAYNDILSATFTTQRLALTAMYLERFRDLVLGNSTTLDAINKERKKTDREKLSETEIAKELRGALVNFIEAIADLHEEERSTIMEAINRIESGHVASLFHTSFKNSLIELYEKADLDIDRRKLSKSLRG